MTTRARDSRTIKQILFSRKREVDIWPSLKGCEQFYYPAKRNPGKVGTLSAMLCKACVVALRGDITHISEFLPLEPGGNIYIESKSQTSDSFVHKCMLLGDRAFLTRGNVTYHLGLLFLAQALASPDKAKDLLDALEEVLEYRQKHPEPDAHYDLLLMHLSDELYYWMRYWDGDPRTAPDLLESLKVRDASEAPENVAMPNEIDHRALTDIEALRALRRGAVEVSTPVARPAYLGTRFRGPQLAELIESLELGMHCLLVGPTATGKSLCAMEAFRYASSEKPVFVIEGHESLREFDLLGGYTPDGRGGFAWSDGVLVKAMRAGGFLLIDEANRMPTRTLNVLLGILSRGAVVLTEHGSEEVNTQEGFQVVMAMNLGQGYAVNVLDRALLDRFPCVIEFRYLPATDEIDLLIGETGVERPVAEVMVKVANETRKLRKSRELSAELTPRGLFAWAKKFQAKKGSLLDRLQDAASVTWLHQVAGIDSDGYIREDVAESLLSLIEAHLGR